MTVEKFPGPTRFRREVRADEIYAQPEPSDFMVWQVCPWLRVGTDDPRCEHCPKWEPDDGRGYGPSKRGCYVLASEVCRVVMVVQTREASPEKGPSTNG